MRIFSKILWITFVVCFVLSVCLSITLAVSSSTIKTFSANETARSKAFYTSYNKLSSTKEITITSTAPYTLGEEGQTSKDEITCKIDYSNVSPSYDCKMISTLFNADSSVARISYFPGDDFKYTIANEIKTKTAYPNTNLVTYYKGLVQGLQSYSSYLIVDKEYIKTNSMSYTTKINFNFNRFTILKQIDVNYLSKDEKRKIELTFNNKDYITQIKDVKTNSKLKISYKFSNLDFPMLVGFNEA